MAQYKVTYTLFEDTSKSVSLPGMFSLVDYVQADGAYQAEMIVQAKFGPTAGQIQAQLV